MQKKVFYDRSAQTDTIEPQVVISPPSPSNSPEGVQTAEPLEEPAEAPISTKPFIGTSFYRTIFNATVSSIEELSESEVRSICSSDNFLRFLRRSSLVIERALAQQSDPTIDYGNEQHVYEIAPFSSPESILTITDSPVASDSPTKVSRRSWCLNYHRQLNSAP